MPDTVGVDEDVVDAGAGVLDLQVGGDLLSHNAAHRLGLEVVVGLLEIVKAVEGFGIAPDLTELGQLNDVRDDRRDVPPLT